MRDTRKDPREGDIFKSLHDDRKMIVDMIKDEMIYYRVFCSNELIAFYKCQLSNFLKLADKQCQPARRRT